MLFGSFNERMYSAEAGGRSSYIPASFPGRHHPAAHRHALHGLCRRDLSRAGDLQRAVRRAVPHPAARHRPRQGRGDAGAAAPASCLGRRMRWRCSTRRSTPIRCWCASRRPSGCATAPRRWRAGPARSASASSGYDRLQEPSCTPPDGGRDGTKKTDGGRTWQSLISEELPTIAEGSGAATGARQRLMFAVAYPLCLASPPAAPAAGAPADVGLRRQRSSVFGEARAPASSCMPFAFR